MSDGWRSLVRIMLDIVKTLASGSADVKVRKGTPLNIPSGRKRVEKSIRKPILAGVRLIRQLGGFARQDRAINVAHQDRLTCIIRMKIGRTTLWTI
jgi:hypothetical protein